MQIIESEDRIFIKNAEKFDLETTLNCGQCFRWESLENNKFFGTAHGKEITVFFEKNDFVIENSNLNDFNQIWRKYFDLTRDYSNNLKLFNIHPILKKVCECCPKIHILRQDSWETLCSFIISQNNNISRIKRIIGDLCEIFGEKLKNSYSFPSAEIISTLNESELKVVKCGFRSKYIIDAAKKVFYKEVDLEAMKNLPIDKAREMLLKIYGVGPKIAECVLLYGYGHFEAFPLDVWMKRIMKKFFSKGLPKKFKNSAGLAQQYLYHYARNHPKEFF